MYQNGLLPQDVTDGGSATSAPPPIMGKVCEAMLRLGDAVAAMLACLSDDDDGGLGSLDGAAAIEVQSQLRRHCDRLVTLRMALLAKVEVSKAWQLTSSTPSFANWLAGHDQISRATANREVQLAQHLADDLPAAREAALAGLIGFDHARVLSVAAPTTPTRVAALAAPMAGLDAVTAGNEPVVAAARASAAHPDSVTNEEYLVGVAQALPFSEFSRTITRWAERADSAACERAYDIAKEKEHLYLSPTLGGWDVRGFLTEEHGQLLNSALGAITSGMFTGAGMVPAPGTGAQADSGIFSGGADSANQSRADGALGLTPAQRRAQALADLAQLAAETGMLGAGVVEKRHLVVNIAWAELLKLAAKSGIAPGELIESDANLAETLLSDGYAPSAYGDGRGPIPTKALKRMACDSTIHRVVFGPDSQILNVGRTYRTVPAHIRHAVIARDKHCVFPGCDQPPQRCEVHHAIRHWADGGATSAENSALLCWQHHAHVDETNIAMRFNGAWQLHTETGQQVHAYTGLRRVAARKSSSLTSISEVGGHG